jgi:hypothetical protein
MTRRARDLEAARDENARLWQEQKARVEALEQERDEALQVQSAYDAITRAIAEAVGDGDQSGPYWVDGVRLLKERAERAEAALGDAVARPQPPTCETCKSWRPTSEIACDEGISVLGVCNMSPETFGCTLWSARPTQEGNAK